MRDALASGGRGPADPVGMPLSLHFGRELKRGLLASIQCEVTAAGKPVQGVLLDLQNETSGVPGCVVFVPLAPLPSGEVTVVWRLPRQVVDKGSPARAVRFLVK